MDYPSSLSLSITPNAYGEPESVGSYASGIQYHPNGSIKSLTYGNGRIYTTTQDARQLPLELKVKDGGTNIARLTHYYDANANITSINDGVTSAANRTMTYDNVDRLKTANGIWGSGSYTYDALGNIKTKNEGSNTVSISYNATTNRVATATINSSNKTYSHDARGNVTNNGYQTFTYNLAGNMVTSSSPSITNYYDGHKRRVRVVEGSTNKYTMYGQSGTLLHKKDGGVETDYIYAGSLLIAKKEGPNVHYLHTDLLGSPIDGKVNTTSYTENYSPWGEKLDNPIQLADDVGFTGHQSDVATGLTYMQARYYDPVIGRFMAVDPIAFETSEPMTFSGFSYVRNNPFRYSDPTGMTAHDDAVSRSNARCESEGMNCTVISGSGVKETSDNSQSTNGDATEGWAATLGLNRSAVYAGRTANVNGLRKLGLVIGTGSKQTVVTGKFVVLSTSSVAGPLPTHQWRFTVHAWPLDETGSRMSVAAGPEWFDPVHATTVTGGPSVEHVFEAVGTAPGGFLWTIGIPNQPSAHDNAGAPAIGIYEK